MKNTDYTLGSWITRPDCGIAEIMAKTGYFDWLTVDLEHSCISTSQAEGLIRTIQLAGVEAFVRVHSNEPVIIKKMLDAGADGIIVPMVNSAQEVKSALNYCYYPPKGTRGVGLARAQSYGPGFNDYKTKHIKQIKLIIQIEHIQAVRNIEEIFSVKGTFGYFVGPYDLSGSLGKPGDFTSKEIVSALAKIKEAGIRHNLRSGYHVIEPDFKEVEQKIKDGYKIIAVSLDMLYLLRGLELPFKK